MNNAKYKINPNIKPNREDQIIAVFQEGRHLDYTTLLRANKLTFLRKEAYWLNEHAIMLVGGKKKRKEIKKELLATHGRKCYICGNDIPDDKPVTMDHMVARRNGGTDKKKNCKTCCDDCNQAKLAYSIQEFIQLIKEDLDAPIRKYPQITSQRLKYLEQKYNGNDKYQSMNIKDSYKKGGRPIG